MDQIRAKLEVHRLEQKYTRRDKRKTFSTAAIYVDGEYVYNNLESSTPTSPTSDRSWGSSIKRSPNVRIKELIEVQGRRIRHLC